MNAELYLAPSQCNPLSLDEPFAVEWRPSVSVICRAEANRKYYNTYTTVETPQNSLGGIRKTQ